MIHTTEKKRLHKTQTSVFRKPHNGENNLQNNVTLTFLIRDVSVEQNVFLIFLFKIIGTAYIWCKTSDTRL